MKIVQKTDRLTQVKKGNKIVFEVLKSRDGKKYSSITRGLGLVLDCSSLDECLQKSFERMGMINEDFKKRLVSL